MERPSIIAVIVLTYVFLFLIPPQNFPINDDPIFYLSVKNYVQGGSIWVHPYVTPTFILQDIYGIIISKIFGLSHKVLMASTMVIAGICVIATYFLLRSFFSKGFALIGSMILLTNPIFYNLSHSFMTDVPALTFTALSIFAIFRGIIDKKDSYLFIGSLLAILSFMIRQTAIIPIAGVFMYLILKKELNAKKIMALGLLPIIIIFIWSYGYYFVHGPSSNITLDNEVSFMLDNWIHLPYVLFKIVTYIGFFFFPAGFVYMLNYNRVLRDFLNLSKSKIIPILAVILSMLVPIYKFIANKRYIMPFGANIIEPEWLGPVYVAGTKGNLFPDFLWIPITLLSFITIFCIFLYALKLPEENKYKLLLCITSSYALMSLHIYHLDRYYLPIVVVFIPIVIFSLKDLKFGKEGLILMILIFGTWSFYGTYDYFSWNSARWNAIEYLLDQGVPVDAIDGGIEYNLLNFLYNPPFSLYNAKFGCAINSSYLISINSKEFNGEVPYNTACRVKLYGKYTSIKSFDYYGPFGEKLGTIYVLKKIL